MTVDKLKHNIIALIVASFCFLLSPAHGLLSIIFGISSSVILGVGKEIYDKHVGKEFDWWDVVVTILGGIEGIILMYILTR